MVDCHPMRIARSLSFIAMVCFCGMAAGQRIHAAAPVAPVPKVEGAPRMQGVAYRFFDDRTGVLTGQLRITHVDMEYRKQGFMRVAWRPQVVLSEVDFEVSADMAWPLQGTQIVRALLTLGGREELVFRDVRVHLAGTPGREITAPSARLLPDGALELIEASLTETAEAAISSRSGTFRLALTGANAGQLRQMSAIAPRRAAPLSTNNNLTQLDP
jgi:hypothetical protein